MARIRRDTPDEDGNDVLPLRLVETAGRSAAALARLNADRRLWMRDHHVDEADLLPLLRRSRQAHGVRPVDALDRARMRAGDSS